MKGNIKVFVDTNILIYLYSVDEIEKRKIVKDVLKQYSITLISTQVINEFINVMHKKRKISFKDLSGTIKELQPYFIICTVSFTTIEEALVVAAKYQFSFFDSLIIAAALENECNILYTEDLHHQQLIQNTLKIINPFKI